MLPDKPQVCYVAEQTKPIGSVTNSVNYFILIIDTHMRIYNIKTVSHFM